MIAACGPARTVLARGGVVTREASAASRSVFVPPAAAHGLWLALGEAAP